MVSSISLRWTFSFTQLQLHVVLIAQPMCAGRTNDFSWKTKMRSWSQSKCMSRESREPVVIYDLIKCVLILFVVHVVYSPIRLMRRFYLWSPTLVAIVLIPFPFKCALNEIRTIHRRTVSQFYSYWNETAEFFNQQHGSEHDPLVYVSVEHGLVV